MVMKSLHRMAAKSLWFVLSFAAVSAFAVDLPANYTRLDWIESDAANKQWIDTEYVPSSKTIIRAQFMLRTRSENWAVLFGACNVSDNTSNGVLFRYYNSNQSLQGMFGTSDYNTGHISCPVDQDYDVELKSESVRIGSETKSITTNAENIDKFTRSIYIFCGNNVGSAWRHQPIRLYSMQIYVSDGEGESLVRDFLPCIDPDGKYGLWDTVGGEFYGNKASNGDFTGGGLKYVVNNGVMTASEGELPAGAMTGITKIEKITSGTFGVGAYATLPAVEVQAGGFSLQNNASVATTATSLSIFGGASLGFDVTAAGSDSLAVGSLALDSTVTDANPITIKVNPFGVVGLDNSLMLLSGGNLSAADLTLFTLDTTLPSVLEIVDGNLVLSPVPVAPGVWTGTGGNGNWSTDGNWDAGEAPANGAAVTLGVAAGGTTTMDISGYVAKSITIPAESARLRSPDPLRTTRLRSRRSRCRSRSASLGLRSPSRARET